MRSVALSLLGCVACEGVSEPDLPPPTLEIEARDDFGTIVRGPGYVMEFQGGSNRVHLPVSFVVGETEKLHRSSDCQTESEAGIAVYPAVLAAANSDGGDPSAADNFLSIDNTGPHIARITVGFSLDYQCDGPQQLTGRSVYTFYPTGRIIRQDQEINASTTRMASTAGCSCNGNTPNEFFFTSYWAFVPSIRNVDRDNVEVPEGAPSNGACSVYDDETIGVQFERQTSRIGVNGIASHVFDFVPSATSLDTSQQNLASRIQIDPSGAADCGVVLDRLATPKLQIGDREYEMNGDGFYLDDIGLRSDPFEIRPEPNTSLPPGFTLSVELESDAARITRSDGADPAVLVQRDFAGSPRFFLVFQAGLADGESILVEPQ